MPDRSRKKKRDEDVNEAAARILRRATEDGDTRTAKSDEPDEAARKLAARILGRRGGLKGGPARAEKLSAGRRSEIAKKAAEARWSNREDES